MYVEHDENAFDLMEIDAMEGICDIAVDMRVLGCAYFWFS